MAGKLIYLGPGWIPGVPACDHEEADEEAYKSLIASGIYRSESGREIKVRAEAATRAKSDANRKAAEGIKAEAVDARSEASAAERAAERLRKKAEEAEARATATAPRRGGR